TLSSTVECSARKNCWKTKPILVARTAASWRSSRLATSSPVIATRPLVGRSRVPTRWRSVDFPEPDGPTTATSSPAPTLKLTPRKAGIGGGGAQALCRPPRPEPPHAPPPHHP